MELDQPALMLVLNVAMIAGIAGLALACYSLKRDNQMLLTELARQYQTTRPAAAPEGGNPGPGAIEDARAQGISRFVAERRQEWATARAGHTG